MLYCIINEMGKGKTLLSTLYALMYSILYPKNKIYANYTLKLSNAVFTPYLFIPISELESCLIIADDFYALKNAKNLLGLIVNCSRKLDITVIITCQYYAMIQPIIRTLSQIISVDYDKEKDLLGLIIYDSSKTHIITMNIVENAVERVKNIYDTKEVVKSQIDSKIKDEIVRFSHNLEDLETNISYYTSNQSVQKRWFKELSERIVIKPNKKAIKKNHLS
jgi:hypothetical protein